MISVLSLSFWVVAIFGYLIQPRACSQTGDHTHGESSLLLYPNIIFLVVELYAFECCGVGLRRARKRVLWRSSRGVATMGCLPKAAGAEELQWAPRGDPMWC